MNISKIYKYILIWIYIFWFRLELSNQQADHHLFILIVCAKRNFIFNSNKVFSCQLAFIAAVTLLLDKCFAPMLLRTMLEIVLQEIFFFIHITNHNKPNQMKYFCVIHVYNYCFYILHNVVYWDTHLNLIKNVSSYIPGDNLVISWNVSVWLDNLIM